MIEEFLVVMKNGKMFNFNLFLKILAQLEILLENQDKDFISPEIPEMISVVKKVLATESGAFFIVSDEKPKIGIQVDKETVKSLKQMDWLGNTGIFSIRVAEIIKSLIYIGDNILEMQNLEDIIANYEECVKHMNK